MAHRAATIFSKRAPDDDDEGYSSEEEDSKKKKKTSFRGNGGNTLGGGGGHSIISAPSSYVPGNGWLDRQDFSYQETMGGFIRRNFQDRQFLLRLLIAAIGLACSIQVEMGVPYTVIACLYFMIYSMSSTSSSSGSRTEGNRRSAYAALNKPSPHQRIHGDISFQDLDGQLRGLAPRKGS